MRPSKRYDTDTETASGVGPAICRAVQDRLTKLPYPALAAASLFGKPMGLTQRPLTGTPTLTQVGPTLAETLHEEFLPSNNIQAESVLLMASIKETRPRSSVRRRLP